MIGWLGPVLSLPQWVLDLSPYSRTPQLPVDDLAWAPLLALTGIGAALVLAGLAGFRRRDLATADLLPGTGPRRGP